MIRMMTLFWLALMCGMTGALFFVKHQVQDLERQVVRTEKSIRSYENGIRILQAEWSLLTSPQRLMRFSRPRDLTPLTGAQFSRFTELPETFAPEVAERDEGRATEQNAGTAGSLFPQTTRRMSPRRPR